MQSLSGYHLSSQETLDLIGLNQDPLTPGVCAQNRSESVQSDSSVALIKLTSEHVQLLFF